MLHVATSDSKLGRGCKAICTFGSRAWGCRPGLREGWFRLSVPKIRGCLILGPYNKDPTISGTILGSPIFGKKVSGTGVLHQVRMFEPTVLYRNQMQMEQVALAGKYAVTSTATCGSFRK